MCFGFTSASTCLQRVSYAAWPALCKPQPQQRRKTKMRKGKEAKGGGSGREASFTRQGAGTACAHLNTRVQTGYLSMSVHMGMLCAFAAFASFSCICGHERVTKGVSAQAHCQVVAATCACPGFCSFPHAHTHTHMNVRSLSLSPLLSINLFV